MIINSPPGIPIIHRLSPCKFYYPPSIRSDPIREIYSLCLEINLNTFEITLQRNVVNDIQWGSRRRVRFKKEKKNGETKKKREREKKYNSLDRTSNGKHRGERLQIWIINRATQWAGRETRESLWNIYELIVWEPSKY